MRNICWALAQLRRLLRPPRVVAVTRRPAGWLAVGRRRLCPVVAWAVLEDDQVVGLVASRRGLRPATGRRFSGFLPGGATSARDVQLSAPAVSVPVADLVEAIGPIDGAYPTTPAALAAIYDRLKIAAEDEWAIEAMLAFVHDPNRFLHWHLELRVEHVRPAELDDAWQAGLAAITKPGAGAGVPEEQT